MRRTRPANLVTPLLLALLASLPNRALPQSASYDQPYRPQVHFSPREHWTNDPNGLVFFHGEYHLFFQYNPFGDEWGHMSWGHAVSTDLLHWQELPVAIPEGNGVMIFTGSIVIDHANSSGFCAAGTDCLVAVYTGYREKTETQETRQNQNLAYSTDNGRTWTKYAHNPVLDLQMADFRDPSVFWDDKGAHWVMVVSLPKEHKVSFYASPNLKDWTRLSDFGPAGDVGGDWECPDLLRVPSSAGKGEAMWALKIGLNPGAPQGGSGEQYFLGNFDGKSFIPSPEPGSHGLTNYGKDDYCAISFNGLPKRQQPTLIGWMSNWQYAAKLPTSPWRGQMSIPRTLSLRRDADGLALKQEPVIAPLRVARTSKPFTSASGQGGELITQQAPYELRLTFAPSPAEQTFGIRVFSDAEHSVDISFDRQKREFSMDRTRSGLTVGLDFPARTTAPLVDSRPYDLIVIVDRSSIEAFAQDGTIAMTNLIYPLSQKGRVERLSGSGKQVAVTGESWKLESIWK